MVTKNFVFSLSGGGLNSLAYAGFTDALRAHNITPGGFAGLSGGALFAELLASGYSAEETLKFVNHLRTLRIFNTDLSRLEILDHHRFISLVRELLPFKTFEQLPVPVSIFASDLIKHQPVSINKGDLASAIVASCSVFPLLQPVKRKGLLLGDGGFTVYYGAQFLRQEGYDKVIGVDVTGITEGVVRGLLSALYRQINSTVSSNARYELSEWPVDLDIRISFSSPNIFFFNRKARYLIRAGKESAEKNLRKIKKLISPKT